jgi:putative transposase
LRNRGKKASYSKVSRLMALMGLSSIHNRHRTRSLTNSKKARGDGYPNLVRGQKIEKPRTAVCSDITYHKTGEGWLYQCIVKDIASGDILGEATSENMKKELVVKAFLNAQAQHSLPPGTIFHSDRGSQYTSKEFMDTLKLYGMRQSFSRVGMPGDNSWAESFFATLKKECIHFNHFATRDELEQTLFAWIYCFYNTKRVQARLGYISPKEYASILLSEYNKAA